MADTSGAIKAGRAFIELFVEKDKFKRDLASVAGNVQTIGREVTAMSAKVFAGTAAIGAGLLGSVKMFADSGDIITKMGQKTGVGAEALSSLSYAASQSGSNLEAVGPAINKMQKYLVEATTAGSEAADTLEAIGLSAQAIKSLSPDAQFKAIADKIAGIQDPATKTAVAMRIFGKSGAELIPLLDEGSRGIQKLQDDAKRLGIVFTADMAAKATETGARMDDLTKVVKQAGIEIGYALAPSVITMSKSLTEAVKTTNSFIREHHDLIKSAAKGTLVLGGFALAIGGIGSAAFIAGGFVRNLTVLMGEAGAAAVIAHGKILGVIGLAAAAGYATGDYVGEKMKGMGATNLMSGIPEFRQSRSEAKNTGSPRLWDLLRANPFTEERAKQLASGKSPSINPEISGLKRRIIEDGQAIDAQNIKDPQLREAKQVELKYKKIFGEDFDKTGGKNQGEITKNRQKEFDAIDEKYATKHADALEDLKLAAMESGYAKEIATTTAHYDRLLKISEKNADETKALEAEKQQALANLRVNEIRDAQKNLDALVRAGIQNPYARERAGIEATHKDAVKQANGDPELIAKADEARRQALANQGNAEANDVRSQERDVQRLSLEVANKNKSNIEQQRALLDLERQFAIEDAARTGANVDLINKQFDLRQQLVDLPQIETRGVTSSFEIQSLQGNGGSTATERTAKATESMLGYFATLTGLSQRQLDAIEASGLFG